MSDKTEKTTQQHEFNIVRIYTKDISYECPNSPEIFNIEWAPQVDLDLNTEHKKLTEDTYEAVLQVTVTVKLKDKTAFLTEIKQAGIFNIKNFPSEQLDHTLGSFCPNILFPYARELISETITRGGFPPLYLAPINFDAYHQDKLEKRKNTN